MGEDQLVETTLSFASGLAISERSEEHDLGNFLRDLQRDMLGQFDLQAGDAFKVRLRPNSTRRALRNVIENAQRYGGGARISYGVEKGYAVISVTDSGPGLPENELERVFEPFFRLEASRSLETGGHGLGLSIARTIIRSYGGDIRLRNRASGGLCATISLPIEEDKQM